MMKSMTPDSASRDAQAYGPASSDPAVRATTDNVSRTYAEVVRDGPIPYGRPSSSPAMLVLGERNVEEHAGPSFDAMSESSERSDEERESTSSEMDLPVYDSDVDEKTFLGQGASQAEYDRSSSRISTRLDDYDYQFRAPSSLAASPEVSIDSDVDEAPDNVSDPVQDVEVLREKLRGEREQSIRDTTGHAGLTRDELIRETETPEIRPGSGRQVDQVSDLQAELESLRSQFEAQGEALAVAYAALDEANKAINQASRLITRLSPAIATLSKSDAEHARNLDPKRAKNIGQGQDVSDDRLRDQEGAAFSAVVRATCRDMPETLQSVKNALAREERDHEGR